ncbi:SDR family NAD(P)-dependent oxidoreductase [Scytonema sp. UIC 10036]|uniref:SDR family NAD(P)-dependent oxidoreductase n=1 Tax=Scytonema sp. UIC 10036 TaxID=2304196 RepID=UPI0012DAF2D9|nr:SDR family NAD(P)-dependent oxidoreductase [Scytonema sp. UIC 10036]MUG96565.1 SDR family NAD(P)-dependent oxidoreductase [Scytonema sp. UIC 10036]
MSFLQEIKNANALIIGASQGIGIGFVKTLLKNEKIAKIYATYRQPDSASELLILADKYRARLTCLSMDITDESQIAEVVQKIRGEVTQIHLVINCVGILHESSLEPEKSLRQINSENLMRYFQVNSIGSVLLAKHLLPLLRHKERSVFACISAKLGSISDNQLGGWYGYRASKAALNMFVRTVAIEYGRTSPKTIVVSLHPGTTDTRLSKPFQANVPPEKLFSVERTVTQLLSVIEQLQENDSGKFFSWDGSQLPW